MRKQWWKIIFGIMHEREKYWKGIWQYVKRIGNVWEVTIIHKWLSIIFVVSQTVWFMVSSPNSAQWAACTGEKFSPNCVNSVNFWAGNRPFPEQNWTLFGSSLLAVAAKDSNPCWLMVIWCCMRSPNGVNYTTQYAGDYISHGFCMFLHHDRLMPFVNVMKNIQHFCSMFRV